MSVRGLMAGIVVGVLAALILAVPAGEALSTLAKARGDRDRLTAAMKEPVKPTPLVADRRMLHAQDVGAAQAAMARRIKAVAHRGGVLVEAMRSRPDIGGGLAGVSVRLSGNEKAVIALADSIERGDPLMRFTDWRIEAIADGSVRLQGQVVAPWQN